MANCNNRLLSTRLTGAASGKTTLKPVLWLLHCATVKTTSTQGIWKCSLRNDRDRLVTKMNRTFRTLRGQVRALLTKILHNTQDNKIAMFKQSVLVKDSFHLVQQGCVIVDKSLFRLPLVTFFQSGARSVFKIFIFIASSGETALYS